MRKLSAHYIFTAISAPLPYGIIDTEENGTIIRVLDTGGVIKESSKLEFYPGILIPGIVFQVFNIMTPEEACNYMLNIQQKDPKKTLQEIIRYMTFEAAITLSKEYQLGSFEAGKKPGIHLIEGIDIEKMRLTERSKLKILIRA